MQVSKQPPAATCSAVLCHAPLSKLTQKRVACPLTSHSRGLLGVLPMWIEYPHRPSRASTRLFITRSSINIKARHSATHADYAVLVIPKCAAHGVREVHTLILAVMIFLHLVEGYMAHEYSIAITLGVKDIVLFGCIFIFLAKIYMRRSLVCVLFYM